MGRPGRKLHRLKASSEQSDAGTFAAEAFIAGISTGDTPERSYSQAVPLSHRRRFAQFFTPPAIASLMAEWALAGNVSSALDPACGMGALVRSARERKPEVQITTFEIDATVIRAYLSTQPDLRNLELIYGDFLTTELHSQFDAVLMNPPYLRHHDISYDFDIFQRFSEIHDVAISRLSNSYLLFTLKAMAALKPGGRAAIIIPTEWMNANFGGAMKAVLLKKGWLRELVYFSNCSDVFGDALTTASILLLEKEAASEPVTTWYIHGAQGEEIPCSLEELGRKAIRTEFDRDILLNTSKWDFLIREGLQKAEAGFVPLQVLASTKRGLATGSNEYFHISAQRAADLGLPASALQPCIGKATDIRGFEFSDAAFQQLKSAGRRTYLVQFGDPTSQAERRYIKLGEQQQLHERYLCTTRKPWYVGEKQLPAPIWAAVFGRQGLRFIHNRTQCLTLTTFHCVYPNDASAVFAAALTACLNAPSTRAKARAHMRVYGGGLQKFEPRDLLEIQVPDLRHAREETIKALAECQKQITSEVEMTDSYDSIDWSPVETLIQKAALEAAAYHRELPAQVQRLSDNWPFPKPLRHMSYDEAIAAKPVSFAAVL